jgi:DNA adenine methylase
VRGRTYGASPVSRPRINLLSIEEELSEVHLRLTGVSIEHLPNYNLNFEINDFKELAETLAGIKSFFVLDINDHSEMR